MSQVRVQLTDLVYKLQLLPSTSEAIGVDKAAAHRSGVENHVSGNAHQNVPIISCVGETTHRNTGKGKERTHEMLDHCKT